MPETKTVCFASKDPKHAYNAATHFNNFLKHEGLEGQYCGVHVHIDSYNHRGTSLSNDDVSKLKSSHHVVPILGEDAKDMQGICQNLSAVKPVIACGNPKPKAGNDIDSLWGRKVLERIGHSR